jgi:hypothetical protein
MFRYKYVQNPISRNGKILPKKKSYNVKVLEKCRGSIKDRMGMRSFPNDETGFLLGMSREYRTRDSVREWKPPFSPTEDQDRFSADAIQAIPLLVPIKNDRLGIAPIWILEKNPSPAYLENSLEAFVSPQALAGVLAGMVRTLATGTEPLREKDANHIWRK